MMKKIKIILGVSALCGALALAAVMMSLNSIVKSGVETFGPKVLGASVRLSSVSLSPFSGKGAIKGLVIGNPKGYNTPSAFELDEVRIAVDIRSLFSDTIIIDEIHISGPRVSYETGLGGSNIKALMANVKKFSGSSGAGKSKTGVSDSGPAKKVIIRRFAFLEGKVSLSSKMLKGKVLSVPLPGVRLRDIGGKKGTSPAKAAARIFSAITGSIVKAAGSAYKASGSGIKAAGDRAKGAIKGLKSLFRK